MSLHYDDEIVLWTYFQARNDDTDPSLEEVRDWDRDLFDSYETTLLAHMPNFGIALTRRNKSRIVLLAQSADGKKPATRVKNACEYFANASRLDLDEPPGENDVIA